MSKWSASVLVTKAIRGRRCKKDRSNSSASTTVMGPVPATRLDPKLVAMPPKKARAPVWAWCKIHASKLEVVVLPWVPPTATQIPSLAQAAKTSARLKHAKPDEAKWMRWGWCAGTAGVQTTRTSFGWLKTGGKASTRSSVVNQAPSWTRASVKGDGVLSYPPTVHPRAKAWRAKALMPMPPMPRK